MGRAEGSGGCSLQNTGVNFTVDKEQESLASLCSEKGEEQQLAFSGQIWEPFK